MFRFYTNVEPGNAESKRIFFDVDHTGLFHDADELIRGGEVNDGIGKVMIGGGVCRKKFRKQGK